MRRCPVRVSIAATAALVLVVMIMRQSSQGPASPVIPLVLASLKRQLEQALAEHTTPSDSLPKRIVQLRHPVDDESLDNAAGTWDYFNRDWAHEVYRTDEELDRIMRTEPALYDLWTSLPRASLRVDWLRMVELHRNGGFYADGDTQGAIFIQLPAHEMQRANHWTTASDRCWTTTSSSS